MVDLIVKRLWHDARASNIPVDLSVDGSIVKPLRAGIEIIVSVQSGSFKTMAAN